MSEGHEDYPRPTSELECARILHYRYLSECIISERLLREQHDYIRVNYPELINLQPRPCGCTTVNNRRCTNCGCYNRNGGVACPASCGQFCFNNPWDNDLFVIGKKTYLQYVEGKGHGIFANEDLPCKTYIGEFTGKIQRNFVGLDAEAANYAFRYDDIGLVIDSYRQGNGCSRINHSCDPNCVAKLVVHNTMLKVVIVARRKIPKDTELTINYFWEHANIQDAPQCNCETNNCKQIIGYVKLRPTLPAPHFDDETNRDEPVEFVNFGQYSGGDATRLVSTRPNHFPRRPENYQETHRFLPNDNVFALIPENGQLLISGVRVMECYRNSHGIYIYVVRRTAPGMIDYHLPRWLLFHHQEDAIFRRDNVFSPQDRNFVLDYATPHANSTMGQHLEFELVLDYVERFRSGSIPPTVMLRNSIQGPVSLGAPSYRLQVDKKCEQTNQYTLQRLSPSSFKKTTTNLQPFNQRSIGMYTGRSFGNIESDAEEDGCQRLVVLQPRNYYRVNQRRDFNETITHVQPAVMMRRLFENAVEQVSILAFSRMPANMGISFGDLVYIIRTDLEYHYYWSEPHQRRFLFFVHYLAATEAESPGSMHLGWCSLCKKTHTFKTFDEQMKHFEKKHYIVPMMYVCPKCKQTTNFPTEFRDHLNICDPTCARTLREDIMPFIIDAYADFIARQDDQGEELHLFEPGLPEIHAHEQTLDGEISMNPRTGQPKSASIKVIPKTWKISKNCKEMDSWENLTYGKTLDPPSMQSKRKSKKTKEVDHVRDKTAASKREKSAVKQRCQPAQYENDVKNNIEVSSSEVSIFYAESDKSVDNEEEDEEDEEEDDEDDEEEKEEEKEEENEEED